MMHWLQWLNEISGHCRNIALGKFKLECDATDIGKVHWLLIGNGYKFSGLAPRNSVNMMQKELYRMQIKFLGVKQ